MNITKEDWQFAYKTILMASAILAVICLVVITHDIRNYVENWQPAITTVNKIEPTAPEPSVKNEFKIDELPSKSL